MRHRIPGAIGLGAILGVAVMLATGGTVLAAPDTSQLPPPPSPIVTSPNDTPTPVVTPTQNPCEIVIIREPDAVASATASLCPTPNPCASPIILTVYTQVTAEPDSVPTVTPSPCSTPVESFAGETGTPNGTPPPTGSTSDRDTGQTPIFALLIATLFGGLGLAAARVQRRGLKRR
jgi:hypothetical protein